jgi:hypothetical protein
MLLTFVSQNLKFGGLSADDGTPEDRWPALADRFRSVNPAPDFLMLIEARGWDAQGYQQLARAMQDLDMDALPLAPSKSGQPVALMYKRETVGRWKRWNTGYTQEVTQSFGVSAFDVGLPSFLSVVPAHLDPFRKEKALEEAFLIANRGYRYGPFAVIGGDINYPPARGPGPDYAQMRPYNIAARSVLNDPSKDDDLEPYRQVAWAFQKSGYVDVADYLYEKTGDESLLQRTSRHDRIDQFWVTQALAPAIVSYRVLGAPLNASDHKGIVFQLDTDKVDTSITCSYD